MMGWKRIVYRSLFLDSVYDAPDEYMVMANVIDALGMHGLNKKIIYDSIGPSICIIKTLVRVGLYEIGSPESGPGKKLLVRPWACDLEEALKRIEQDFEVLASDYPENYGGYGGVFLLGLTKKGEKVVQKFKQWMDQRGFDCYCSERDRFCLKKGDNGLKNENQKEPDCCDDLD